MPGHGHKGPAGAVLGDTHPAALQRYSQLLRARAPHERLAQAIALTNATRELAVAGIRQRHPNAAHHEIQARLAVLLYGRDLAQRLFGVIPSDAT